MPISISKACTKMQRRIAAINKMTSDQINLELQKFRTEREYETNINALGMSGLQNVQPTSGVQAAPLSGNALNLQMQTLQIRLHDES